MGGELFAGLAGRVAKNSRVARLMINSKVMVRQGVAASGTGEWGPNCSPPGAESWEAGEQLGEVCCKLQAERELGVDDGWRKNRSRKNARAGGGFARGWAGGVDAVVLQFNAKARRRAKTQRRGQDL